MTNTQTPDFFGVYRAIVLDSALGKTSQSGVPQLVQRYHLTEYYDQKEGEWYDVTDNNWLMTGYFCLYGRKDGEIMVSMNHTQVCKVYGWDGCGFDFLADSANFVDKVVQVRVVEDTYEKAKSPMKISWLDQEDAEPVSGLKSVAIEEVSDLEAEFGAVFAKKSAPVKAKSAPAKAKATPRVVPKATPKTEKLDEAETSEAEDHSEETREEKKARLAAKYKKIKAAEAKAGGDTTKSKAKTKAKPAPVEEEEAQDEPEQDSGGAGVPEAYGKKDAWGDIYDLKDDFVDDETVESLWKAAIVEISDTGKEASLDNAGWYAVRNAVLSDIGVQEG